VTRSGHIVEANEAFLEMVGRTQDDLRSGRLHVDAITPPEYLDVDARSYIETESRGVGTAYEKEYIRKDGSRVPVLTGTARLEDVPNEDICFTLDLNLVRRSTNSHESPRI
jgi:PAS domain S-box-containing protein